MPKGDFLRQVVEIVIGGIPVMLEVRFLCMFMSLGGILLHCSVSTKLFNPMWHEVDIQKAEVGMYHLGNIYLMADIIPPAIQLAPLLEQRPSFTMGMHVYLLVRHEFCSEGMNFGVRLIASSPELEIICEGVKTTWRNLHVAQCCIIVSFILSINLEFYQCQCAPNCMMESGALSGASAL